MNLIAIVSVSYWNFMKLEQSKLNRFYDQSSQAVTAEYKWGSRKDGNAGSNGADSVASPQRIIIILSLFIPTLPSIGIL